MSNEQDSLFEFEQLNSAGTEGPQAPAKPRASSAAVPAEGKLPDLPTAANLPKVETAAVQPAQPASENGQSSPRPASRPAARTRAARPAPKRATVPLSSIMSASNSGPIAASEPLGPGASGAMKPSAPENSGPLPASSAGPANGLAAKLSAAFTGSMKRVTEKAAAKDESGELPQVAPRESGRLPKVEPRESGRLPKVEAQDSGRLPKAGALDFAKQAARPQAGRQQPEGSPAAFDAPEISAPLYAREDAPAQQSAQQAPCPQEALTPAEPVAVPDANACAPEEAVRPQVPEATEASEASEAPEEAAVPEEQPASSRASMLASLLPEIRPEDDPDRTVALPRIEGQGEGEGADGGENQDTREITAVMDPVKAHRPHIYGAEETKKRKLSGGKIVLIVLAALLAAVLVFLGLFAWNRWYRFDDALDMQGEWKLASSDRTLVFTEDVMKIDEGVDYQYTIDTRAKTITYYFGDAAGTASYRFSGDRKTLVIDEENTGTDWLMAMHLKKDSIMSGGNVPEGITKLTKLSDNTQASPQNLNGGGDNDSQPSESVFVQGYTQYSKPSLTATNDTAKNGTSTQDGSQDQNDSEEDGAAYVDQETGNRYYYDETQQLYYDQNGNFYYDMYGANPYTVYDDSYYVDYSAYAYTDSGTDTSAGTGAADASGTTADDASQGQ